MSHSYEYKRYLKSKQWKSVRWVKLNQANHKCEKCGAFGPGIRLEIHHLHYESLGNENVANDLMVTCDSCHPTLDRHRKMKVANRRHNRGLETYAAKKYGEETLDDLDWDEVEEEFDRWLEKKGDSWW